MVSANNLLWAIVQIHVYASMNLYSSTSTGDSPALISVLVETNVVPHIQTVTMAIVWYMMCLCLSANAFVLENEKSLRVFMCFVFLYAAKLHTKG